MYEDLYEDNPRYLLICYLPINQQIVYQCSDIGLAIGMFNPNQSLQFEVEITLTGEGMRKTILGFDVEVSRNKILIRKADRLTARLHVPDK